MPTVETEGRSRYHHQSHGRSGRKSHEGSREPSPEGDVLKRSQSSGDEVKATKKHPNHHHAHHKKRHRDHNSSKGSLDAEKPKTPSQRTHGKGISRSSSPEREGAQDLSQSEPKKAQKKHHHHHHHHHGSHGSKPASQKSSRASSPEREADVVVLSQSEPQGSKKHHGHGHHHHHHHYKSHKKHHKSDRALRNGSPERDRSNPSSGGTSPERSHVAEEGGKKHHHHHHHKPHKKHHHHHHHHSRGGSGRNSRTTSPDGREHPEDEHADVLVPADSNNKRRSHRKSRDPSPEVERGRHHSRKGSGKHSRNASPEGTLVELSSPNKDQASPRSVSVPTARRQHVSHHHHHHKLHSKKKHSSRPTSPIPDRADSRSPELLKDSSGSSKGKKHYSKGRLRGLAAESNISNSHSAPMLQALVKEDANKRGPSPSLATQDEYLVRMLQQDTHNLVHQFQGALAQVQDDLKKPNVLIAGITGVGKSSLINSIFGSGTAKVGSGAPITQNFALYTLPDVPVNIYDSKGLETGKHKEFITDTENFFEEHKRQISRNGTPSVSDEIHVIWYIVSASSARFHPFEKELIEKVFNKIPLIFLLSKCDSATETEIKHMRSLLSEENFSNCVGIYETVSKAHVHKVPRCPVCHSRNVMVHQVKKLIICDDCNESHSAGEAPTGLSPALRSTKKILPLIVQEAFISAQNISFRMKNKRARRIISEFYHEASHVHLTGSLVRSIAKMLTRLSILWNFREHGHLYGTHIAKATVHSFNFRAKVFMFVHKNSGHCNRSAALGIIWHSCCRSLAGAVLRISSACETDDVDASLDQVWPDLMGQAFAELSEERIDAVAEHLEANGISSFLDDPDLFGISDEPPKSLHFFRAPDGSAAASSSFAASSNCAAVAASSMSNVANNSSEGLPLPSSSSTTTADVTILIPNNNS